MFLIDVSELDPAGRIYLCGSRADNVRVDLLVKNPQQPVQSIHQIAVEQAVLL